MPTDHIIALLVAERDKLNRAIEALQGPIKRRGRPPRNPLIAVLAPNTTPAKKRKSGRSRIPDGQPGATEGSRPVDTAGGIGAQIAESDRLSSWLYKQAAAPRLFSYGRVMAGLWPSLWPNYIEECPLGHCC